MGNKPKHLVHLAEIITIGIDEIIIFLFKIEIKTKQKKHSIL